MGDEAPPQSPPDLGLDRRYAHLSAAAGATARIIESLSKTSRALRFYAPNNQALQVFVRELYDLFDDYFGVHLDLTLKIRPEELLFASTGEVVYHDDDRENGFPFKLYRDGIRVLSLRRGLSHDEIMRIQRILSMRSLGKMVEEDVATQLWRIRSAHIQFKQVRGFVDASQEVADIPLEDTEDLESYTLSDLGSLDMEEPSRLTNVTEVGGGRWFNEWRPLEGTDEDDEPTHGTISEAQRAPFGSEQAFAPGAILAHVVTRYLDAGLSGVPDAPRPEELKTLLEEARYSLLVSGEIKPLLQVVKVLADRLKALPLDHPWRGVLGAFILEGGGRSTVRLLLGAVGQKTADPRQVIPLLQSIETLELTWMAESLADIHDPGGRLEVARTVVYLLWPDQDALATLGSACSAPGQESLVQALLQRGYAEVQAVLLDVFEGAEPGTQGIIADAALEHASRDGLGRLARLALQSPVDVIRERGLRMTLRADNPRLLKLIEALVDPAALLEMSRGTAARALATWVQLPGREKMERLERGARPVRLDISRKQEELRIRHMLAVIELGTPRAQRLVEEWRGKGSRAYQKALEDARMHASIRGRT